MRDRLIELLETHEFGLLPARTYEIDYNLISNYGKDPRKAAQVRSIKEIQGLPRSGGPLSHDVFFLMSALPTSGHMKTADLLAGHFTADKGESQGY